MSINMEIFSVIGITSTICVAGFVLILITNCVKEIVYKIKRNYQYKHRFDKPPKADCYCIDCLYRNPNKVCSYYGYADDTSFCWRAEPSKKMMEEKNEYDRNDM